MSRSRKSADIGLIVHRVRDPVESACHVVAAIPALHPPTCVTRVDATRATPFFICTARRCWRGTDASETAFSSG
jgi:hypothetical protein